MAMFRQKEREQPKEQGGAVGDEYVTYEINSRKAQNLAELAERYGRQRV